MKFVIETKKSCRELVKRIDSLIEVGLIDSKKSKTNESSFELKIEKEDEEYILAGEFGDSIVDKDGLVDLVEEMENLYVDIFMEVL